ncbi:MAG TPA: family 16 glycosylhydrolase [Lacipirellula sp.]
MIVELLRQGLVRGAIVAAALVLALPPRSNVWAAAPGWDLVWNDEFEGSQVDPAKWTKEVTNNPANNEQQGYTAEQVTVSGGNLVITSENIPTQGPDGQPYRSGRVHSNFTKKYGRWEVRADLPTSKGMWPAIWLLPDTQQYPWPSGGEIDIMENRGQQPQLTSSAYHWGASWRDHQFRFSEQTMARFGQPVDFHDGFHTYSVEWDATKVRFFVDDVHHWTLYDADTGGFLGDDSAPMWTMLNTAVGGDFLGAGGQPDGTTVWPQKFLIDYVRISDRNNDPLRFRNGGFEQNDGSLAGWSVFGNRLDHNNVSVHNEAVAGGDASLKIFGQFRSTNNFSGVSQGITVSPGDPVEASAESFIRSQDALAAGTQVQMKIEFYSDFGGRHGTSSLLDEVVATIADPASMQDVWRPHELSAVAPAGAVEARIAFVFVQSPANGGGAIHLDNVSFRNLNLPSAADADGNGVVDGQDMLQWQRNLGKPDPDGSAEGDFNLDGAVDRDDLDVWQEQSGAGTANQQGSATPIPEPSSTMMALTGLAGLLRLGAVRGERSADAASQVVSAE